MSLQIPRSEAIEIIACGLFNWTLKEKRMEVRFTARTWLDAEKEVKEMYRRQAACALDNILAVMKRNREARTQERK